MIIESVKNLNHKYSFMKAQYYYKNQKYALFIIHVALYN